MINIRRTSYILLLHLLIFVTHVIAENDPTIYLKDGTNKIFLSIYNNWENDLNEIKLEIEKEKLPSWLKIDIVDKSINVPRGMRGTEKINITFEVYNAPSFVITEIPFTFIDNRGNLWNYALKVCVNSNLESDRPYCNVLHENFPNPFNSTTTIKYTLAEEKYTKLEIYNSLGQKIKTLVDALQKPGIHTVQWNGKDEKGNKVSSGLYIYQLISGSFIETKRMMLVE